MSLYDILGVSKGAATEDIRKSYRRLAMEKHPDRGGNTEEFQKLQEAHEILTNPESRAHYDATGQIPGAAGGGGGPSHPDLASVFGAMFGGGGPGGGGIPFGFPGMPFGGGRPGPKQRQPRGPNKMHDVGLSLSDLYHGKRVILKMSRDAICGTCSGKGGSRMERCGPCQGNGMRQVFQQMGPMMAMQLVPCDTCNCTGQSVADKCATCNGGRVTSKEVTLEMKVEPGMQDGDRLVIHGACSESPDFDQPGDVILVVRAAAEAESIWLRKGAELATEIKLTLAEAMMGWSVSLENHPSGRPLRITWRDGPIRDGEVLRVPEWGMPNRGAGAGGKFGELRLICRVSAQTEPWSAEQFQALRQVWPAWKEPTDDGVKSVKAERIV
jgi:DnaJ family protein A protein 2